MYSLFTYTHVSSTIRLFLTKYTLIITLNIRQTLLYKINVYIIGSEVAFSGNQNSDMYTRSHFGHGVLFIRPPRTGEGHSLLSCFQ